jgi:HD-like signal output (HDOD) protein
VDVSEVRTAIDRLDHLSTISVVLNRIWQATGDPSSPPQELYKIISYDQALAERILRVANSTFFRHCEKVGNIRQAILLLGYEQIRDIAVGMSVVVMLSQKGDMNIRKFWAHSYEVASISAMVAEITTILNPTTAFLTGLLHDAGRLLFYNLDKTGYRMILGTDDLLDKEVSKFGCDHALAGSWLAERAHLPEEQVLAIRYHHAPSRSTVFRDLTSALSISEALSRRFSPKIEDDGIWTDEHDALLLELSLTNDNIRDMEEKLNAEETELKNFLEIV